MKCPRCNAQLADDAGFCGICGYALSALPGNVPNAGPSLDKSGNNEVTMLATPWANQGPQAGPPPRPSQPVPVVGPGSAPAQNNSWQPQRAWRPEPVQPSRAGVERASMSKAGSMQAPPKRRRRRAGCITSIIVTLVLLVAILTGAWFLGVRPYLHNLVVTELNQALTTPESQVELALLLPGSHSFQVKESLVNQYLSQQNTDQVQNLHMTISPTGVNVSFTAYGQDCSISALPITTNGQLQVTNVQVQGALGLIMSNDELTSALNSNFQTFSAQMSHKITKLTLLDQEIDVQLD